MIRPNREMRNSAAVAANDVRKTDRLLHWTFKCAEFHGDGVGNSSLHSSA
jgi:hypothetical protein